MTSTGRLCCVPDFEKNACETLPRSILDYYRSGACEQITLKNNRDMFDKLRIRPRVLIDVSRMEINTKALGFDVKIPIGISPTAMQKMAHVDGEIGSAKAIGSAGGIYIHSILSTTSLEDVAIEAPATIKWLQLYIYKNRDITKQLVQRAENAGFEALVLTVDANVLGTRYAYTRNSFQLPPHLKLGNFEGYVTPIETAKEDRRALNIYAEKTLVQSWKDVLWLKQITNLPIILKGILTAEDAVLAVKHEVAGIMVSNHGGRQLDTSPATIEALPEIVAAVGNKIDILFDGGIRFGTDIFKALALGAKMVFVGRPVIWGLAHSGESGVKDILNILINEFETTMGLTGCQNISDIKNSMVVHESHYYKF